jgi:hypothetical protein
VLSIRIEDDNLYWNWAAGAFGGVDDLSLLDMDADPDGDKRQNLHEMVFFTNPLARDEVPVGFRFAENGGFSISEMTFDRRVGSQEFVSLLPATSPDLSRESWRQVDPTAWDAVVEPGPADREKVHFRIYGIGLPKAGFYRIESRPKPAK